MHERREERAKLCGSAQQALARGEEPSAFDELKNKVQTQERQELRHMIGLLC